MKERKPRIIVLEVDGLSHSRGILVYKAKDTLKEKALEIVKEFLTTEFAGGRHERRVNKLMEIEQ